MALLTHFLNDNEAQGGSVILRIINNHLQITESMEKPTLYSAQTEYEIGDNEGIFGHVTGRPDAPLSLTQVKLGPRQMDKEMIGDVEEALRDIDAQRSAIGRQAELGVTTGPTLLEEFQARIKREESEDSPMADQIPLPPYKGADIVREVQAVKDARERFKLEGTTPPLPSICMYTFHHTNNGYLLLFISPSLRLTYVQTQHGRVLSTRRACRRRIRRVLRQTLEPERNTSHFRNPLRKHESYFHPPPHRSLRTSLWPLLLP